MRCSGATEVIQARLVWLSCWSAAAGGKARGLSSVAAIAPQRRPRRLRVPSGRAARQQQQQARDRAGEVRASNRNGLICPTAEGTGDGTSASAQSDGCAVAPAPAAQRQQISSGPRA